MNLDRVRPIADAVLYEGYVLYPYRASAIKNRCRWTFGVVMPGAYARTDPSERAYTQAECVVEGAADPTFLVALRFLHVQARTVQRWTGDRFVPTESLDVDGIPLTAWQEAVEREVIVAVPELPHEHTFRVGAARRIEDVRDRHGQLIGRIVRRRRELRGAVAVASTPMPGPWRASSLRVRVDNHTSLRSIGDRSDAVLSAFVAAHTVISVAGGAFLSMTDPPEWAADAVAGCVNVGTWPVLAGEPGDRDLMLCAPIILSDHPRIAPESAGDMFDATEIDEILTLRTLTLSDDEKREARMTDARAAALIDRTESLAPGQMRRLHGTIRRAARSPEPVGSDVVLVVAGEELTPGRRVRLRPGIRRADAQDMFLAGRTAVVEAVLRDVDDRPYLAVTLADDPGADIHRSHGRFRYFAPDEVEPLP